MSFAWPQAAGDSGRGTPDGKSLDASTFEQQAEDRDPRRRVQRRVDAGGDPRPHPGRTFRPSVDEILICDDSSARQDHLVARPVSGAREQPTHERRWCGTRTTSATAATRRPATGWAIEHGLDIVVLLHGDGQYAPECLPEMVAPLERGECDAVFGSRMMVPGARPARRDAAVQVRRQPHPHEIENAAAGTQLTEFHSGYRAYRVAALAAIPFERNSDGFDFDTQIIVQLDGRAASGSSRSRSRPTTATRSATSTGSSTPGTCFATSCSTGWPRWASARTSGGPRRTSTCSRRVTGPRTRRCSRCSARCRPHGSWIWGARVGSSRSVLARGASTLREEPTRAPQIQDP